MNIERDEIAVLEISDEGLELAASGALEKHQVFTALMHWSCFE
jgi:hypothetical protein